MRHKRCKYDGDRRAANLVASRGDEEGAFFEAEPWQTLHGNRPEGASAAEGAATAKSEQRRELLAPPFGAREQNFSDSRRCEDVPK